MPAEPAQVEDPNDPGVILRDLPEQERAEFLRQYHRNGWPRRGLRLGDLPAELSQRALGGFPAKAFDDLIATMATVVEYPDDPLRTFATSDPYTPRAEFGTAGLVTCVIDDACQIVTLTGVTWVA
ncbi:MAG: hypothetical protein JWL68_6519 [Actinomycetia bacterium]|nr:hypothetical protein [Actinomycetes bacterium]